MLRDHAWRRRAFNGRRRSALLCYRVPARGALFAEGRQYGYRLAGEALAVSIEPVPKDPFS